MLKLKLSALILLIFICIITCQGVMADVKLNGLFSDNAILQQGMRVPVWGSARDGEKVTVDFRDQHIHTVAHNGKWMINLRPMKPGGPFTMRITGDNTIELRNVMVGEVWLCSGQSNMIWTLGLSSNALRDVPDANDPMLRLFQVPPVTLDQPSENVESSWRICTPDSAKDFSAVAYYFGKELRRVKGVPLGLINASGAATMIQAFMSRNVLEENPDFRPVFQLTFPPELQRLRPCGAYNGMVHPLAPYAIRGVIWYQGEANTHEAALYKTLFPAMIHAWRSAWRQGDFPFLFVQLPPFESQEQIAFPRENEWAEMREAQLFVSKTVSNTAMIVTMDVGERHNIHPTNKEPVGRRLAMTALAKVYGDKGIGSGPVYRSMVVMNSCAVLSFDSVGEGLEARDGELTGFTIAGDDMKFIPAHASIQGDRVVVSSPDVTHPVEVRYGWSNYPEANLFNKDGFPASPFRTDNH